MRNIIRNESVLENRVDYLLRACKDHPDSDYISDVHVVSGSIPWVRIDGIMKPLSDSFPPIEASHIDAFIEDHGPEGYLELQERKNFTMSYHHEEYGRVRAQVAYYSGNVEMAIRRLKEGVPELATLNLPRVLTNYSQFKSGLILATGGNSQGKSTTLAALINEINKTQRKHIITIEDPVEYYHTNIMSLIQQQNVGMDVPNTKEAIRSALRSNIDVLLFGEIRDWETLYEVLQAAGTGHLVYATLHVDRADTTPQRIISMMPGNIQNQVKTLLANNLKAVIAQKMVPLKDKKGTMVACEIMGTTPEISAEIMGNCSPKALRSIIQSNRLGMTTLEQQLISLVKQGKISEDEALTAANERNEITSEFPDARPALRT